MDIFDQWKHIEEEKFIHKPAKKGDIMEAIYQKSTGTMEVLKTRLKYKMIWIGFFVVCFVALAIWQINNTPAAVIFGVFAMAYGLGFLGLRKYFVGMGVDLKEGTSLGVMKRNYQLIKGALSFESNVFLAFLPAMIIGSILVPGLIDGKNIMDLISEPRIVIAIGIAVVVLGPLVQFMGKKMNKIAYGEFINKLKENIKEMEVVG